MKFISDVNLLTGLIQNDSSADKEHIISEFQNLTFDIKKLNMLENSDLNECTFDKASQVRLPESSGDQVPAVQELGGGTNEIIESDKVKVTEKLPTELLDSTIDNNSTKLNSPCEGATLKNLNFR